MLEYGIPSIHHSATHTNSSLSLLLSSLPFSFASPENPYRKRKPYSDSGNLQFLISL
jgi:hypothetical protein